MGLKGAVKKDEVSLILHPVKKPRLDHAWKASRRASYSASRATASELPWGQGDRRDAKKNE